VASSPVEFCRGVFGGLGDVVRYHANPALDLLTVAQRSTSDIRIVWPASDPSNVASGADCAGLVRSPAA
jgi:hypothetical protein